MVLSRLISNIENLNIEATAAEILSRHTAEMAELNREQLINGLRSDMSSIVPRYAYFLMPNGETYADFKNQMNSKPGFLTPDLKLTGAFHRSIKYSISGANILATADDPNGLESKYSDLYASILKLSEMSRSQLISLYLRKTTAEIVKSKLIV